MEYLQNKNITRIAILTVFILMIPLVAMQFTDEVNWNLADFVVMGVMLFSAGLAYELVAKKSQDIIYRYAVGLALVATFLLVWVNGAVGIIADDPINVLYLGIPVVLIIGAAIARLKPKGMARTLIAMAFTQALIPIIALVILLPDYNPGVVEVIVLNGFFIVLFVESALLFQRAARNQG